MQLKKGDIIDVIIEKVEGTGKAVARIGQFVIFVNNGIPGQKVSVVITRRKNRYAEAVIHELLEDARNAIAPRCPWFGKCGGCVWQNVSYDEQLKIKQSIVQDAIRHIGKHEKEVLPILASPQEWYYRNKIELSFGLTDAGYTDLGFRKKGCYDLVLPIDQCEIFDPRFSQVLFGLRKWLGECTELAFDMKSESGYFQYCMIRKSHATDQWLFNIITRSGKFPHAETLIALLQKTLGSSFASLYHTVNYGGVGYAHHDDKEAIHLYGDEYITDHIGDLKFMISPFSFFQTNTQGAKLLYDTVAHYADIKHGDTLIDLYCGAGTIGQYVGFQKNVQVYGVEIVDEAIDDAWNNAKMNGIENVQYYCGDARIILKEHFAHFEGQSGVTIVDPPRSGLSYKALQRAIDIGMKKFIYVSCNPATFARDMLYIHENSSYQIQAIQPVDMFPHTSHVELVALFE